MKSEDKELKLMMAFVESKAVEDIDLMVELLELSLEADRSVCQLTGTTMSEEAYYARKVGQAHIQHLIMKLK